MVGQGPGRRGGREGGGGVVVRWGPGRWGGYQIIFLIFHPNEDCYEDRHHT